RWGKRDPGRGKTHDEETHDDAGASHRPRCRARTGAVVEQRAAPCAPGALFTNTPCLARPRENSGRPSHPGHALERDRIEPAAPGEPDDVRPHGGRAEV